MTCPIHPGPFFWAAPKLWKPAKLPLPQNLLKRTDVLTVLSLHSSSITNHAESHLIYGPLEYTLFDQGFPVEYELDAWNQLHLGTPLCRLQLLLCRQRCVISLRHPVTSSLGNIFWRLSCFSPTTTRTTHSWVTTSFLSLTSKHDLCYTYGDHISLRHSTMP